MRLLPSTAVLVAFAGCADISGLTGLEVTDGATGIDVMQSPSDASDAHVDDGGGGPSDVVPPIDGNGFEASTSYCAAYTTADFCADFDENDVLAGYSGGKPATWTTYNKQALPTLDKTTSASPPASAAFTTQQLGYSLGLLTQTTLIGMSASVYVTSYGTSDSVLFSLQLDAVHWVNLVIHQLGDLSVNETMQGSDGGFTTVLHTTQQILKVGSWISIGMTVDGSYIDVSVGGSPVNPIQRQQTTNGFIGPSATIETGGGWSTKFDNVVIVHK